jgi:MFS family permease
MTPASDRRWLTLAIVGAAFFMTVLDVAIVNVAIPSIQIDLHINEQTVQWVITASASSRPPRSSAASPTAPAS